MCHPADWPAPLKRALTLLVGGAIGIGALISVLMSSGGLDDVREALESITAGWAIAALAAMLAGYLLLALHLRRLSHGRISLWQALRVDVLLFGLGNVLPGAPAPGAVLAAAELRRAGLPGRIIRFMLAFTAWFNTRTLLAIGAVAFLVAFARQHPGLKDAGLWWLAAVGVLLLLAATARMAARPAAAQRSSLPTAQLCVCAVMPGSSRGIGPRHRELAALFQR